MIDIKGITKSFGNLQVLKGIDLHINKGVTIVRQNIENKIRKHDRYQRYNQIIWQFTGAQRH